MSFTRCIVDDKDGFVDHAWLCHIIYIGDELDAIKLLRL
jgi:hypothetical protein